MSGFVVIHRAAIEHPLFSEDPSRLGAWVWMISRACWKPTRHNIRGAVVTLDRGQFCMSVRQLAEEWRWSKSAVDRFLSRLETETMIERKAGHGRLIITICNYSKYQDVGDIARDSSGTPTGTAAGQQRDIKEQGNKETIEPRETNVSHVREVCQPIVDAWNAMAGANDLPRCTKLSDKRRKSCLARIKADGEDAIIRAIEHVPRSSFLSGRTGSWSGASFDFLMRPDSVTNILEGKYDDRRKQPIGAETGRDGAATAIDRQLGLGQFAGDFRRADFGDGEGDRLFLPPADSC